MCTIKRNLSQFNYKLDSYDSNDQILEDLREEFVNSFPVDFIRNNMTIEEYAEGHEDRDNFCYRVERKLNGLGSARGGTAKKFGIYYSKDDQKYIINKVWQTPEGNPDVSLSFKKLKNRIADLIEDGENEDIRAIAKNPLSPMFKMKILSLYYPDKYLNIFSEKMLDFFLFQFYERRFSNKVSLFKKQKLLLEVKNADKVACEWNNIKFGNYLYHLFPEAAALGEKDEDNKHMEILNTIVTPKRPNQLNVQTPEIYEKQAVKFRSQRSSAQKESISKINYIEKQKKNIKVGYLGEKLVFSAEIKKLKDYPSLQRKVTWLAKNSDAYGYDILSYDKNGNQMQIEVKSTSDQMSDRFDFVLTENERQQAMKLSNYWIYKVFSVDTQPVIYKVKNPFKDDLVNLTPIRYKAQIKVKDVK